MAQLRIEGKLFDSLSDVVRAHRCSIKTVSRRIEDPNYPDWVKLTPSDPDYTDSNIRRPYISFKTMRLKIGDRIFGSYQRACEVVGVSETTLKARVYSPDHPDYGVIWARNGKPALEQAKFKHAIA